MKHYHTFLTVIILLFTFISSQLSAATYYVSNAGSNSNTGTSWAQAWLTLHYAAQQVDPGDTVWIANGIYAGFDIRTSGTAANPIVFIAAGAEVIINSPNPVTPDGINVENADYIEINGVRVINQPRNGIRLVNADFCIVRNTYCDNNFERGIFTGFTDDILIEYNECLNSIDEHGIYVSNSSDRSIIRYNICHHNNRGGIQINADGTQGGDGISSDPQIYGNILYENGVAGGAAINLDGVQGAFIYNNLLYNNHASGIALFRQDGSAPSTNATIVHNTIINASDARWCILAVNGSSGAQVYNNILINLHAWRGSIALDPNAEPGFSSDYNLVVNRLSNQGDGVTMTLAEWQTLGYDLNSLLTPPVQEVFISPATNDYHLVEGSPAINAGSTDYAFGIWEDLDGLPRPQGPQSDMGAYESQSTLDVAEEENDKPVKTKPKTPALQYADGHLSWPEGLFGTLHLYSLDGKVCASANLIEADELDLTGLHPGMYIAVGTHGNALLFSQKIVVAPAR